MSLIRNKRAHFDYEILDKYEAGLELFGFEVKSLQGGHGSLAGSYIILRDGEAFLVGATVPPYQPTNTPNGYEPERPRKLLLNKGELATLRGKSEQKGLTFVPISVYNKGRRLKLEFAVARGKKKHDKRSTLKERDDKRHVDKVMKDRR